MKYSDSIEALKAGLMQYSENEKKLSELYKQAIANAESGYKAATKQINDQYKRDRNTAHADTVREERNLNNALAARGLGFSGEAAQTKLNSNIILANRLSELNRGKANAESELLLDLSDKKNALAMDNAEKLRDIQKGRDNLNSSIASILGEREDNANKIQAEKELQASKLQAEKEMLEAELKAKKEMLEAELSSKNTSSGTGNSPSGGGSSGNGTSGTTLPNISAKELAKQLISTASGGKSSIDNSHAQQYSINKYLLELTEKYNVSDEYLNELIFMLRTQGYEDVGEANRRIDVITYDAISYYYSMYDKYYNQYIKRGVSESKAASEAKKTASGAQMDYIYKNSRDKNEFKKCCKELGISTTDVQTYLNEIEANESAYTGSKTTHPLLKTR